MDKFSQIFETLFKGNIAPVVKLDECLLIFLPYSDNLPIINDSPVILNENSKNFFAFLLRKDDVIINFGMKKNDVKKEEVPKVIIPGINVGMENNMQNPYIKNFIPTNIQKPPEQIPHIPQPITQIPQPITQTLPLFQHPPTFQPQIQTGIPYPGQFGVPPLPGQRPIQQHFPHPQNGPPIQGGNTRQMHFQQQIPPHFRGQNQQPQPPNYHPHGPGQQQPYPSGTAPHEYTVPPFVKRFVPTMPGFNVPQQFMIHPQNQTMIPLPAPVGGNTQPIQHSVQKPPMDFYRPEDEQKIPVERIPMNPNENLQRGDVDLQRGFQKRTRGESNDETPPRKRRRYRSYSPVSDERGRSRSRSPIYDGRKRSFSRSFSRSRSRSPIGNIGPRSRFVRNKNQFQRKSRSPISPRQTKWGRNDNFKSDVTVKRRTPSPTFRGNRDRDNSNRGRDFEQNTRFRNGNFGRGRNRFNNVGRGRKRAYPSSTLYIEKFEPSLVSEASLRDDFGKFGDIEGINLFSEMRYAFVKFKNVSDARDAKSAFQATTKYPFVNYHHQKTPRKFDENILYKK